MMTPSHVLTWGRRVALAGLFTACISPIAKAGEPVADSPSPNPFLLSFFRDNGQAGVYLALSEDGYTFSELNDGKPIFTPPPWPDQDLTRDPSIIYHEGWFHMVWTTHWQGRIFGYASSPDLITSRDLASWQDQTDRLSVPKGSRHGTVFRAPRSALGFPQTTATK